MDKGSAQSFVTSHSASVLSRIAPRDVRYFRNCRTTLVSSVKEMPLPVKDSDDDKFLHQVILSNPEIYFARLVIIGEGDSERIIIPRIAEKLGVPLDPSFVAFVPIGGRHAQHLWRLVHGLGIPCLTLLDFDLGRYGGGMGRIKNATTWLSAVGIKANPANVPGNVALTVATHKEWLNRLRSINVFYSSPLDIDMMMVQAFPAAYVPIKPFDPSISADKKAKIAKSVFGKSGLGNDDLSLIGENLSDQELYTYKKLFKTRSKPASHYRGLATLDQATIEANCPEPLRALIDAAKNFLLPQQPIITKVEE